MLVAEVFDGDGDGVVVEGDYDGAEQAQRAAAGEGTGVEDAVEVFGGDSCLSGTNSACDGAVDQRAFENCGG